MVGNPDVHTETEPTTRKHLKHVDPYEACPSKCIIPRSYDQNLLHPFSFDHKE